MAKKQPIDPENPPEDTKKWIRKLKRVLKNHSMEIWLYAASGGLHVMAYGKGGDAVLINEFAVDPDYIISDVGVIGFEIDGGDW